jgi:hypothetical protein
MSPDETIEGSRSFRRLQEEDMMHLQGSLQTVFDALYELGVIEPILKMDWAAHIKEVLDGSVELDHAVRVANRCCGNRKTLVAELGRLEKKTLEILAMEVAREYAGFHARAELH